MKIQKSELSYSNISSDLYDIFTENGLQVSILSLGASIQKIALKDENGIYKPITLGFNSLLPYSTLQCYAGATLAPNAGRIKNARLPIAEKEFMLEANDGKNQSHGGRHNLSAVNWELVEQDENKEFATLTFGAHLMDGVDGFPGNRTFFTTYKISDEGLITIKYHATTDMPTYINLSNHTYWNLSGNFAKNATDQSLKINADRFCLNDDEHVPMSILPVANTPFDFRCPATLSSKTADTAVLDHKKLLSSQIEPARGYNHAFLLNKAAHDTNSELKRSDNELELACILSDSGSNHSLELYTDAMALVVYSGGFLPKDLQVYDGDMCHPSCAIALEAQDVPDVMHFSPEYYKLTTPDEPFNRTIQFHILI